MFEEVLRPRAHVAHPQTTVNSSRSCPIRRFPGRTLSVTNRMVGTEGLRLGRRLNQWSQNAHRKRLVFFSSSTLLLLVISCWPVGCDRSTADRNPDVESSRSERPASGNVAGRQSFAGPVEIGPAEKEALRLIREESRALGNFSPGHVAALDDLVDRFPFWTDAHALFRAALESRRDWEGLITYYLRRIELHGPEASGKSLMPNREPREDEAQLANALIEASRFGEAIEVLDRLQAGSADDVDIAWLRAKAHYERGEAEQSLRILDENWDQLLAGGNVDAIFLKGAAAFQAGDLATAEEALRKALAFSPRHAAANDCLGRVRFAQGDAEESRHFLGRAKTLRAEFNSREQVIVRRLAHWQTIEDVCRRSGDGDKACREAIESALPHFDGDVRELLERRLRQVAQETAKDGSP